ncbi:inactive pancreatic lipase-related protein 1-like [Periplaneta americana]|uniref:inactive pancreatic lipase-related protein 1-like n=1 Tax=Periplaneta americana TaxID=6978 RepID=UPI0037E91117
MHFLILSSIMATVCVFEVVCGDEVCYDDLGCFPLGKPWSSTLRPVPPPQGPDIARVDFQVSTRKNKIKPYILAGYPKKVIPYFDGNKKTIIYAHEWLGSGNDTSVTMMKNLLLESMDINVVMVDYGYSSHATYFQAVSNARIIGAQIARFCKYLIEQQGSSPSRLHLIGTSLGAQTMAYAAKRIPFLARLTALEPAQPLFEGLSKEVRVDKDDAMFVDVVNTYGAVFNWGINSAVGHVDFFFNGGLNQPGCSLRKIKVSTNGKEPEDTEVLKQRIACGHMRVVVYYLEAIGTNNCTFWGFKRESYIRTAINIASRGVFGRVSQRHRVCTIKTCLPFGLETINYPARGSFDVFTAESPPYCIKNEAIDESMQRQRQVYNSKTIK